MLEAKQRIKIDDKCAICGERIEGEHIVGLHPNGRHYALCDRCNVLDDAMDYIEYGCQDLVEVLQDAGYVECDACGENDDLAVSLDTENDKIYIHCRVCKEDTVKGIREEDLKDSHDVLRAEGADATLPLHLYEEDGWDGTEYPDMDNPKRNSFDYVPTTRLNEDNTELEFTGTAVDLDTVDDEEEESWD